MNGLLGGDKKQESIDSLEEEKINYSDDSILSNSKPSIFAPGIGNKSNMNENYKKKFKVKF